MPWKIETNLDPSLMIRFRDALRIKLFAETGTGDAQTTLLAACAFQDVKSVDIDESRQKRNAEEMSRYKHVSLFTGDSVEFVQMVVNTVGRPPTMWWLDAHWTGIGQRPDDRDECPLLVELATIGTLRGHDVILIDDMQMFRDPPNPPHDPTHWPSLADIEDVVSKWPNTQILEEGNILIVAPK